MSVVRLIPIWLTAAALALPPNLPAAERAVQTATAVDHFEKRVRPLLVERCHKCHAGEQAKGGLRLDSADAVRRGGDSGETVVPGKPADSLLIQAVRHESGIKMPPDGDRNRFASTDAPDQ